MSENAADRPPHRARQPVEELRFADLEGDRQRMLRAQSDLSDIDERLSCNRADRKALRAARRAAFRVAEREELFYESKLYDEALATQGRKGAQRVQRIHLYTVGEEIFSAVVHGVGTLLGVAGLVLLVAFSAISGDQVKLASSIIFGISIICEYLCSTLYHALRNPKAKRVFKVLDHSSIYLLIAGSYTPFTLITLANDGGYQIAAIVWSLAIVGIALEAFWVFRPKWVSVLIYCGMGWLIVFKLGVLIQLLPDAGIWLLVAGGLCYTIGTVFYLLKRVKWMHSIWHIWVLAGTVCHFLAVLLYVIL